MLVPSAFISYAHEDQEFVLALAAALRNQGLDIRFDQVVLRIGDSLIRRLADEITEGDFLIAVVSPDSARSEWCRTEIELALTQGVNERRVKVLPVRYRGAEMPPALQPLFWGDADDVELSVLAGQLWRAMQDHLEGREVAPLEHGEAGDGREAVEVRREWEDRGVRAVDEVATTALDVLAQWDRCREGEPTIRLVDMQRRLRYAIACVPEEVAAGLPFVIGLSTATWDVLNAHQPAQVEADVMEELRSVRTQVSQGLRVTNRWLVTADHGQVTAGDRDAAAYLWEISRGEEQRRIVVYISGTALAVQEGLPPEVVDAKRTHGRSVVTTLLGLDDPPNTVLVTTVGIRWPID